MDHQPNIGVSTVGARAESSRNNALCVDFVSQDEEQAFRDECHTNYRETIKEFYSDVCEGHTEDLPLYMQRFDARDYSTPTEPNSANGRYFIGADDPVETICALLCEEKLPSY